VADAEPLITVIIPTFRRPKLLRRAILSVLSQTFPAFQVCVYDNASNDDTKTVVSELAKTDSRIRYYCHKENIGAIANFNYGLKEVNTPFFSFLSDDDVLLPNFFECAMRALRSNAEVMFYAGSTVMSDGDKITRIARERGPFGHFPPPDSLVEIVDGWRDGLAWTSIVFRSEVIGRVGTLDTKIVIGADTDFQLRIAAHHAIIMSKEPGAIYVYHNQSYFQYFPNISLIWSGFQRLCNKIMSDESLPLDVRVYVKTQLNEFLCAYLNVLGERARTRGESDNVPAITELQARICNNKTKSRIQIGMSKLKELSDLAFGIVSCLRRVFLLITSFRATLARKRRQKQLQERYGKYLQYLQ
jgi:glycosyltransferase involved in cell wall biosynthesis